ncbi:MAG: hypothetical protein KKD63_16700, partial [Proteobacteria bacterium]|nr:hypothetical protein [Pseudomonadota bacterium]
MDASPENFGSQPSHPVHLTTLSKGKIERFFRTVRQQFLLGFCGKTLDDLNLAFELWLNEEYHRRKHSST